MDSDEYETLPTASMSTHMCAGALAGIMEHAVMYPVDSVKVRSPLVTFIDDLCVNFTS